MPEFTLVIPARNEEAYLPATLRAIEEQSLSPAQVIVVDNASRDQTAQIARAWGASVLSCPQKGVAYARQTGLEAVTTDWVATTDADSLPQPDWLAMLHQAASTPGCTAVYGPLRFFGLRKPYPELSEWSYRSFLHVCRALGKPNLAAANMAYSREAALMVGGYPALEAYEDIILGQRLACTGRLIYVRQALVETSPRRLDRGIWQFLWRHFKNVMGHTRGYFDELRE